MKSAIEEITTIAETTSSGTQNVSAAGEEQLATIEEIVTSSAALATLASELGYGLFFYVKNTIVVFRR